MANVTLAQFKKRSRERGDMVNSRFISESEITDYINGSLKELYDLLLSSRGENYYISSSSFLTNTTQNEYPLPADFYKLMGVDCETSGNQAITLKAFMWQERNRFREPFYNQNIYNMMYQIRGNKLAFIPTPNSAQNIKVWYIPRTPDLVSDTDSFDGINGWEEYVVIDVAIKMRVKEESPVDELLLAKRDMKDRIISMSSARNSAEPIRVTDTDRYVGGFRNNVWN